MLVLLLLLLRRRQSVAALVAANHRGGRLLLAGAGEAELRRRSLQSTVVDHEVVLHGRLQLSEQGMWLCAAHTLQFKSALITNILSVRLAWDSHHCSHIEK